MMKLERSHYETFIDTMPVAAVVVSAEDGKVLLINDIALTSLKRDRSKTVGETAPAFWVHVKNRTKFLTLLKKQGRVQDFATTLRRGDGSLVNVLFSTSRLMLEGEAALLSVFKDITPLVQTQTRLREKGDTFEKESRNNFDAYVQCHQRLNHILENSLQGILLHRNGRALYVNQSLCDIIGYSVDEIMSFENILHLAAPEEREYLAEHGTAALRDPERSHHFRIRAIRKDGSEIWVSNRSEIVDWRDGPAVLATVSDITSEVLATRELERVNQDLEQRIEERTRALSLSEARLNTAVKIAKFGYGTWSTQEKTYSYCSGEHASFFGLEPADFIGHPSRITGKLSMTHPADRAMVEAAGGEVALGRQTDIEHRVITADGNERWLRHICVPIQERDGTVIEAGFVSQDTTERRLLELRLRDTNAFLEALVETRTRELNASEAKFRTLAEHSLVGLAIIHDERFIFVNQAWADMYGYSIDELMAFEPPIELIDPRDRVKIKELVEARRRGENPDSRLELRGRHKDGHQIWLDNARVPINWDGKTAHLVSNIEITERKAAESALLESQGLMTSLLENAPYAFSIKDRSGTYLMYKGAGTAVIQRNPREYFRVPLADVFSPDASRIIQGADHQVLETGQTVGLENLLRIKIADTDLRLIKFPIRNSDHEIENIGTIAIDVTRELADRRKLRESERAIREIFESSLIGAGVYSRKSDRVSFANSRLLEILGVTLEQLQERSPRWIWADAAVRSDVFGLLHQEGACEEFVELRKVDGAPIWCTFACKLSPNSDDEVMFWVHDLTDLHETQIALIEAKDQAETSDRAKSNFLSAMSHELRTPLNAVLGFAQLLEGDAGTSLNEDQIMSVRMILSSGELLLSLINEVLDLTSIQDGNVKFDDVSVDIEAMLIDCVDLVSPLLQDRGLSMNFDAPKFGGLEVRGDPVRLKQIILNLLQNAVKYNRDGGAISVLGGVTAENRLRVTISDTGKGIAERDRDAIFTPFERLGETHGAVEGTGIGLTIAKRLIEAMGGSIGVNSELGKGSDFWIELPNDRGLE